MLAREVRPEIGARTCVYSRLSRATRSAASAPWMSACEVREPEVQLVELLARHGLRVEQLLGARQLALRQLGSCALFDASCDCARATSASNGRGSIVNSRSPFWTNAPSTKWTLSMVPATRGRSSTYSVASRRPLNSSLSVTVRCTAGATLTGGAGGAPPCASAGPPQALSNGTATIAAAAKATARAFDAMGEIQGAPPECEGKQTIFDIDDSSKGRAALARLVFSRQILSTLGVSRLRTGRKRDAGIGRSARTARMTKPTTLRAKEKALVQRAFFRFGGCEGRI